MSGLSTPEPVPRRGTLEIAALARHIHLRVRLVQNSSGRSSESGGEQLHSPWGADALQGELYQMRNCLRTSSTPNPEKP